MAVGLWIALVALVLALFYNSRRRPKLNLPPGPAGIPVLGNMSVLSGSKPHQALTDLSKRYGPLIFLRLGSRPCIVASSPEVCNEIFKDQDRAFASRHASTGGDLLLYNRRNLALAPYGEAWRQLRKIATLELLSQRRINQFESLRVAEASVMVRAIHQHNKLHGRGAPVNMRLLLRALGFNFGTQICFSRRFYNYLSQESVTAVNEQEMNSEEAFAFTECIDETSVLLGKPVIGDFIPYLSFLDRFTDTKPRMIKNHQKIDKYLTRLLNEHRKNPNLPNPNQTRLDFMDVLLRLPERLDDDVIKGLCFDLLSGGTETTAGTEEWFMAEVIRNPEVGVKLREEMDNVVGKERLVTEADILNLPYLQAVLKETFRAHSPLPLLIPHESLEQTKVMGYDIPKGTLLFTNVWAIHRDPAVWDNPLQFRPERFLERPDIDVRGLHFQLLPFGSGRRGCPAVNLGLVMVQYALARLVQAFDWSLPKGMKGEELDIEESWGLSLPRANALEVVLTNRLPSLLC